MPQDAYLGLRNSSPTPVPTKVLRTLHCSNSSGETDRKQRRESVSILYLQSEISSIARLPGR